MPASSADDNIYLRARWYDPGLGRFLSRDPHPGQVIAPTSLNGFSYAAANPIVLTDPSGLDPTTGNACVVCAQLLASPVVRGARAAYLALPDAARPDFVRIQGGFENPFGVFTSFVIDRYGNVYVQPVGVAIGTPAAFGSITAGWLVTTYKPSEDEVRSFLEGQSYSGGGALGAALDWTWSPKASGAQHAVEVGVGSPRGGVSVGTGYLATRLPVGW